MIYISSSCVKNKRLKDVIQVLVDNKFKNIELSGGTEYYEGFEDDLLELQYKYDLNYICHNYFPPQKEHFVLNLASLDNEIYEKTLNHLASTIELSKKLGSNKFGFHAGFFIDLKTYELGKTISKYNLFNKDKAKERFCKGFNELNKISGDIELYIENNVLTYANFHAYDNNNIFMLTDYNEYQNLKEQINFNLLLDIAHLQVSSKTLGLDFKQELAGMISQSNYVHISDNDGRDDLNYGLKKDSILIELLKSSDLRNKDFTLEIYNGMDAIIETYTILEEVIL